MTNPIHGPANLPQLRLPEIDINAAKAGQSSDTSFQRLLVDSLKQTVDADASAQAAIGESLAGGDISSVEVFSEVKKADLALRMMLQVRNKMLEAFDELKNMQV
jgi:flagellar hook-basal body complex protein FliE